MHIRSVGVLGRFSRIHMTARAVILALVVLAVVLPGAAAMAQDSERGTSEDQRPSFKPRSFETVPGEIIVKFEETTSPSVMAQTRRAGRSTS